MKDVCIDLTNEIIDVVLDMEKINLSQDEYVEIFNDIQKKLMNNEQFLIDYLMELDNPPYELIEKIKQFWNLWG